MTEKYGCFYCPGCGHKFWDLRTLSGEFEPAQHRCKYCVVEAIAQQREPPKYDWNYGGRI